MARRSCWQLASVDQNAMRERNLHIFASERSINMDPHVRVGLQLVSEVDEPIQHDVRDAALAEMPARHDERWRCRDARQLRALEGRLHCGDDMTGRRLVRDAEFD